MTVGNQFQASVVGFLGDMGRAMTLRRIVAGTYDPTTGTTTGDTTTDYPGTGRLGDYSDVAQDGTVIKESDRKATFLPTDTSVTPQVGDRLVVGSDVYTVVNFKTREIGGIIGSYTLQVRK